MATLTFWVLAFWVLVFWVLEPDVAGVFTVVASPWGAMPRAIAVRTSSRPVDDRPRVL